MKTLLFTIIYFVLHFDNTKQLYVRMAIKTVKTLGKTIKSPIVKTFGNTIKNSVGMFRRNKSAIKNVGCGLQKKYLRIRHNFGSKSVKYLGEESIKKFKYMTHYAIGGSKQLVRANGKNSIQMRSGEQMGRKELGSLVNMVSKSKPQLPFLFVPGGLDNLTQFNLFTPDNDANKMEKSMNKIKQVKTFRTILFKELQNKKYYHDNQDDVIERSRLYYKDNKEKVLERMKKYHKDNKETIALRSGIYYQNNKDKIIQKTREYNMKNKEKIAIYKKEYKLRVKDSTKQKSQERYQNNKDKILESSREYKLNNKDKIAAYKLENKDQILQRQREHYLKNKERYSNYQKQYRLRKKLKKELEDKEKADSENSIEADDKVDEISD